MRFAALVLAHAVMVGVAAHAAVPADMLYGTAFDKIVTIDTTDGTITDLEPQQEFYFQGLTFDSGGRLFTSACPLVPIGVGDTVDCAIVHPPGPNFPPFFRPFNLLVEVDPVTGALLGLIGPMTDGAGVPLDIKALASPPGSAALYGIDVSFEPGPDSLRIWAIDPDTAEATLVTDRVPAGCERGLDCSLGPGLAAHPDGSLVHVSVTGSPFDPLVRLVTLDPESGAELTSLEILGSGSSIALRSDGTIFTAVSGLTPPRPYTWLTRLATIDPGTGSLDDVGTTVGGPVRDLAFSPLVVESVAIEIKPGSHLAVIDPASRGVIPVAILGSESFDVADVDVTTLAFGPAGASSVLDLTKPLIRFLSGFDINHDGHKDLTSVYRIRETGIALGDTEACLTGELVDGTPFEGCDSIQVGGRCGLGFELTLVLPLLMAIRRRSRR